MVNLDTATRRRDTYTFQQRYIYISTKVENLDGLFIVKSACGEYHTVALTGDGDIYTWSDRGSGRLGHGHGNEEVTPEKVEALGSEMIADVVCGWCHTLDVSSTGSIYTWGNDGRGNRNRLPRLLPDLSSNDVISVSAGHYFTGCVTKAREVFTWGKGTYDKLGYGDESKQKTP